MYRRCRSCWFPKRRKINISCKSYKCKTKDRRIPFYDTDTESGVVDLGEHNGFVIADIPGIIEGAAEGVGLGLEFLRHIERTKVIIHIVDAASIDGRDPVNDVKIINEELKKYNKDIESRPTVIAATRSMP